MATSIYEALVEAGYSPRSYSGRGMYGSTCVGVTVDDDAELIRIGAALGPELADERVRTDGMGRSIIVYWPNIDWLPEYGSDDEDEESDEG